MSFALSLNTIYTFNVSDSLSSYTLPSISFGTVSVARCSVDLSPPILSLSNKTHNLNLSFDQTGHGFISSPFNDGGSLSFTNPSNARFEVAFTDSPTPIHFLDEHRPPLFADSDSNTAILLSSTFALPPPSHNPPYPNYTLPGLSLQPQPQPSNSPNQSLVVAPTSDGVSTRIRTACSLAQTRSVATVLNQTLWLRDDAGWRTQWLIASLSPSTNYTAFVLTENSRVSAPLFFTTKSASFPCPLLHSLPYCPSVAYAVPLSQSTSAYDATTLPSNISSTFQSYMSNFTTSLLSFPCGRDAYSPLVTCQDCQRAYRSWLCAVSFPRCAERSATSPPPALVTQASLPIVGLPSPALLDIPPNAPPRNLAFPTLDRAYTILLPCLEVCTTVDRACPNFLGFRCPLAKFSANGSYAVGFIDEGGRGEQGQGVTGASQDQWGNVWCNGVGVDQFAFNFTEWTVR